MVKKTIEECRAWKPKEDFTDKEKIKLFDDLRKMALKWHVDFFDPEGHEENRTDIRGFMSEWVLEATLGKEVFDYTNPLC